jgi:hypothetical protein
MSPDRVLPPSRLGTVVNPPKPSPVLPNQDACKSIAKARFAVRSLQLCSSPCVQDGDISKNVDVNRFPAAEGKPEMFKVRRECREHRADRFSPGSLLSLTGPDEDNVAGAEIHYRLQVPSLERLVERRQR